MHEAPPAPGVPPLASRKLDRKTPNRLDIHLIADNHATHKHAKVKAWLAKHPRFHLHLTPSSASWLNLVERFFAEITRAEITRNAIRRGVFKSVPEPEATIDDDLAKHNQASKPFTWTATAQDNLEKVDRARDALNQVKAGTS